MCQPKTKLTREQVLDLYQNEFASTTEPSEYEIQVCMEKGECDTCALHLKDFWDYPVIYKDKELLCEDCNQEAYMEYCESCENHFGEKGGSNDYVLLEVEGVPGIYKILQRPFFYGCVVNGFEGFFNERLELVKEVEIKEDQDWGFVCGECLEVETNK